MFQSGRVRESGSAPTQAPVPDDTLELADKFDGAITFEFRDKQAVFEFLARRVEVNRELASKVGHAAQAQYGEGCLSRYACRQIRAGEVVGRVADVIGEWLQCHGAEITFNPPRMTMAQAEVRLHRQGYEATAPGQIPIIGSMYMPADLVTGAIDSASSEPILLRQVVTG